MEQNGSRLTVDSPYGVGIPWQGPALVNGRLWPVRSDTTLWLPAGAVLVQPGPKEQGPRILDFNGDLRSATASAAGLEFSYESSARALAIIDRRPARFQIDGAPANPKVLECGSNFTLVLPRGQHVVQLETEAAR